MFISLSILCGGAKSVYDFITFENKIMLALQSD